MDSTLASSWKSMLGTALTSKLWVVLCAIAIAICFSRISWKGKLPPGPKGLPFVGNLFQVSSAKAWKDLTRWKAEFGPLVYLNLAGKDVLILNSPKAAADLLDRRAGIYSDRPRNIVASEIMTGSLVFALRQCDELWRRMRSTAHEGLQKSVVKDYYLVQTIEAIYLADAILRDAKSWDRHLYRATASGIMSLIYDTPLIKDENEPSVAYINKYVARLTRASCPGAHYVEMFTWMKHLPSAIAPWKKYAEDWYKKDQLVFKGLLNDVRQRVLAGDERPSFCATIIKNKMNEFNDTEAAYLAGTMYAAGAAATSAAHAWFMHAMLFNPQVQKKAHEELDAVVGRSRMPSFADFEHLPYIRGIVKEALRLRPVDPLGLPHCSNEDDWYEGYYIPKGTTVFANIWSMNRDPDVYGPNATKFVPERHIVNGKIAPAVKDTKDESHFTFGFGRRICVGRHVANNALFIDIACILWACNILPPKDANGKDILPVEDDEVIHGLALRPVPFDCVTTPRFPEVSAILAATKEVHGLS